MVDFAIAHPYALIAGLMLVGYGIVLGGLTVLEFFFGPDPDDDQLVTRVGSSR